MCSDEQFIKHMRSFDKDSVKPHKQLKTKKEIISMLCAALRDAESPLLRDKHPEAMRYVQSNWSTYGENPHGHAMRNTKTESPSQESVDKVQEVFGLNSPFFALQIDKLIK